MAGGSFFQSVGDVEQHLFEVIAFLADGYHLNHVAGNVFALAQRRGQRVAGGHVLGGPFDGLGKNAITGRILRDPQGLKDGNAVSEQGPQDARETRQRQVQVNGPRRWQPQAQGTRWVP